MTDSNQPQFAAHQQPGQPQQPAQYQPGQNSGAPAQAQFGFSDEQQGRSQQNASQQAYAPGRQGGPEQSKSTKDSAAERFVNRKIAGISPVLFAAIILLGILAIMTIALIFVGEFEGKVSRVIATVIVFGAFTGLLALDMALSRKSVIPLIIGVVANLYFLAVLMIVIWITPTSWDSPFVFFGSIIWVIGTVRILALVAWWLALVGERSSTSMLRILGRITAALFGLIGVALTLPAVMAAFETEPAQLYWQFTIAAIVVTALAVSVVVLLVWNERNDRISAAEKRAREQGLLPQQQRSSVPFPGGEHGVVPNPAGSWPNPQYGSGQPNPGQYNPGQYPQGGFQGQQAASGFGGQGQARPGQPGPGGYTAQSWPRYPNGEPLPANPDGSPKFQ
ncbi:hypothetical protein [Humidisolicoccus flavus]|uniref:hypothetical protein n=1 Tax=Humidisolicoccus flavus TaxID=3111414 RepID=UPI0032445934